MDNDYSSDFSSIGEISNRGDTPESDDLFDDAIDDDPLPTYRCTEIARKLWILIKVLYYTRTISCILICLFDRTLD